jgi:glycosyltransferase involved in cell wall biosynthesis
MSERFSIIVPALNEEDAIEGVLRSCLAASDGICEEGGVDSVEVILVDDGSTDRTAEIASGIEGVRIVSHEANRGYGAALMTGFRAAEGDYLGFLDGDDTCDPTAFGGLLKGLREGDGADLVIGMRLGAGTRMPLVRKVGNRFFATLLRVLSGRKVRDTASGMRVFRRSLVPAFGALPEGLDFTPAMTSRVAFDPSLSFAERPIPYSMRSGNSKLGVVRDGVRFLRAIVGLAISYRPGPFFYLAAALLWGVAVGYTIPTVTDIVRGVELPVVEHVSQGELPIWMLHRLLTIMIATVAGLVFFLAGTAGQRIAHLVHGLPVPGSSGISGLAKRLVAGLPATKAIALLVAGAAVLAGPALAYFRTWTVLVPWYRVLGGLFLVLAATVFAAYAVQDRMISAWERKRRLEDAKR